MPQVAFWDCFSGISGDMALGALIDAGLDLDLLRAELRKLQVPDWEIVATRDVRYGIAGTQVKVLTRPQTTHRHLSDIHDILDRSALDDAIRKRALAVFGRLAAAEGLVHGMAPDEVHFHEVGALDAIVDVVGVVAGLQLLGVEAVYASPLPLGSGWIEAAHGRIPVPGPAVVALLGAVGAPVLEDATPFELVTPTGAALLAELATFRRPAMRLGRAGYGFGSRDTGRLNAVRLWLGQVEVGRETPDPTALERVVLLETNLDDQPGEQLAYAAEQLMAAGALDVWWQPIGMKKGRAAILLSILLRPEHEARMTTLLFRETSSLGIRRQSVERWVCERESRAVTTTWGEIRVKIKIWQGTVLGAAPEYEDCARAAREHDVPLQAVYRAAQRAADDQL
ncbi:MAG TPA: nickel pincer cofactor biosynthesis protein LarC [Herpetosiphonaceae bacterium]|nr:nickel pincer cofactor biosynthesis protein LarC [Herpetosiphonaceae bacterium]